LLRKKAGVKSNQTNQRLDRIVWSNSLRYCLKYRILQA